MTKLQRCFAIVLITILLIFVTIGTGMTTYAETEPDMPTVIEETEESEKGIDGVAEQFVSYLKDKYGEDYETYYT